MLIIFPYTLTLCIIPSYQLIQQTDLSFSIKMIAVYGLMELNKAVDPVHPSQYDIRVLVNAAKTCLNLDKLPLSTIPLGKLLQDTELGKLLLS